MLAKVIQIPCIQQLRFCHKAKCSIHIPERFRNVNWLVDVAFTANYDGICRTNARACPAHLATAAIDWVLSILVFDGFLVLSVDDLKDIPQLHPFPDKSGFASWGCWHVNQVQNAEWVGFVLDETAV